MISNYRDYSFLEYGERVPVQEGKSNWNSLLQISDSSSLLLDYFTSCNLIVRPLKISHSMECDRFFYMEGFGQVQVLGRCVVFRFYYDLEIKTAESSASSLFFEVLSVSSSTTILLLEYATYETIPISS